MFGQRTIFILTHNSFCFSSTYTKIHNECNGLLRRFTFSSNDELFIAQKRERYGHNSYAHSGHKKLWRRRENGVLREVPHYVFCCQERRRAHGKRGTRKLCIEIKKL